MGDGAPSQGRRDYCIPRRVGGWIVYLEGHAKTHFFASYSLALMYAGEWAKANPPSVILVIGPDGKMAVSQTYSGTAVQAR